MLWNLIAPRGSNPFADGTVLPVQLLTLSGVQHLNWEVGKDVSAQAARVAWDEASRTLFAVESFEGGEPQRLLVKKPLWEQARRAYAEIDEDSKRGQELLEQEINNMQSAAEHKHDRTKRLFSYNWPAAQPASHRNVATPFPSRVEEVFPPQRAYASAEDLPDGPVLGIGLRPGTTSLSASEWVRVRATLVEIVRIADKAGLEVDILDLALTSPRYAPRSIRSFVFAALGWNSLRMTGSKGTAETHIPPTDWVCDERLDGPQQG